jgi:hypothetical protein
MDLMVPCDEVIIYCLGFLIVMCGIALAIKVIAPYGLYDVREKNKAKRIKSSKPS